MAWGVRGCRPVVGAALLRSLGPEGFEGQEYLESPGNHLAGGHLYPSGV